jgi:two-component system, OmpR family, sensor kinase
MWRLLVVDDEATVRELLSEALRFAGFAVSSAATGAEARTMRRIDTEARRLTRLVEDLLLLARLDEPAAGPVLDREPMDLRTLAADARDQLGALEAGRARVAAGHRRAGTGERS